MKISSLATTSDVGGTNHPAVTFIYDLYHRQNNKFICENDRETMRRSLEKSYCSTTLTMSLLMINRSSESILIIHHHKIFDQLHLPFPIHLHRLEHHVAYPSLRNLMMHLHSMVTFKQDSVSSLNSSIFFENDRRTLHLLETATMQQRSTYVVVDDEHAATMYQVLFDLSHHRQIR